MVLFGGTVRMSEASLSGPLTLQGLAALRSVKVILGIRALDVEQGLTNNYLDESLMDREILRIASQVIVVADHTKCERVSTVYVAPVEVIDTLVTDTKTPPEVVAALQGRGVNVLIV
jgi:DeoR/GlpR family transcriptional regulator of sugar metabolism